ncbi:MAG: ADP-ribosylation factor-like protein [Promethearchaeia archaeon]
MIHNVLVIDRESAEVLAHTRFWKIDFTDDHISEFLAGLDDLEETEGLAKDTPVYAGDHKVFHSPIEGGRLLLFATDGRDEDRTIQHKVREGAARLETAFRGNLISYIRDNIDDLLGELIFTRFKVSFVGSGGVGKTTLLRLLFGKEPAPGGYVPTINVAVDSSETIQFGTFLVTIWDFAGQAVFQDLWSFYFQGTDVIFLISDSSFRNVMQTKTLLRSIKKEAPAVPLFIIANKQDLPESMRADKIKRLVGAPTFPMVATDKTRREEFIRFMLEVSAKTIGVNLPERPISEMITVRKGSEEIDDPFESRPRTGVAPDTESEWISEPYMNPEANAEVTPAGNSGNTVADTKPKTVASEAEQTSKHAAEEKKEEAKDKKTEILHTILIYEDHGVLKPVYSLRYAEEEIDSTSVSSLISALDSLGSITQPSAEESGRTDTLETIEHEGNHVFIEKSDHFLLATVVTNEKEEASQRQKMASVLLDIEEMFEEAWGKENIDLKDFEESVFTVLSELPLRPLSLDYIARSREAGKRIPFDNREVGRAIVKVTEAIDGISTVGGIVRSLNLPREIVMGALQILAAHDWIDFKVEISEDTILAKAGEPPKDSPYGREFIEKFVSRCDGKTPLNQIVDGLDVNLSPLKFVAQKLVLSGTLEIIA